MRGGSSSAEPGNQSREELPSDSLPPPRPTGSSPGVGAGMTSCWFCCWDWKCSSGVCGDRSARQRKRRSACFSQALYHRSPHPLGCSPLLGRDLFETGPHRWRVCVSACAKLPSCEWRPLAPLEQSAHLPLKRNYPRLHTHIHTPHWAASPERLRTAALRGRQVGCASFGLPGRLTVPGVIVIILTL